MSWADRRFDSGAVRNPPSPSSSHSAAVQQLSEDVSSLLQWGRGVLQQQRVQRRRPSHDNAYTSTISLSSTGKGKSVSTSSTPRQLEVSHADTHPPSESVGQALATPPLYTQQYVQELRQRLAYLQAAEAARAHACAQRLARLERGRARLLREHDPAAAAEHAHRVQRTVTSVQAIVEGEEALTEVLEEVAQCLANATLQQEHSRADGERREESSHATTRTDSPTYLLTSFTESEEQEQEDNKEEDQEGSEKEEITSELLTLMNIIERHAQKLISLHEAQQKQEAEQKKEALVALHQQQERAEEAKAKLQAIRIQIQRAAAKEESLQQELQELQSTRAAQRRAAEVHKASVQHRQAVQQTLHRMALLQAEAETQGAVARHDLAASEALLIETKTALEMATEEHHNVVEKLARAKKAHKEAKRRLLTAEEDRAALQRAVEEAERQCAILQEQRRACEADTETLLDATRERRLWLSADGNEDEVAGNSSRSDGRVRLPEAVDRPAERLAALKQELSTLEVELANVESGNAALQAEENQLLDQLRAEKMEVSALRARKASLESYLTSVEASQQS